MPPRWKFSHWAFHPLSFEKPLDDPYTNMITFVMLARQVTAPQHSPAELTPLLRCACGLLPLFLRVPSFVFNSLQPLLPKTGGRGTLAQVISDFARRTHRFFSPLFSCSYKSLFQQLPSFHIYTKRGVFFASWMEFAHPHSQIRNLLGAPPRSLRLPAAGRPARHWSGLSVIFYSSHLPSRSNLSTFNCRLSTALILSHLPSLSNLSTFNCRLSTALPLS